MAEICYNLLRGLIRCRDWPLCALACSESDSKYSARCVRRKCVGYLHVGGTLISELPKDAANVSPFLKIRVDNTNVSFFWDWVDPMVLNAGAVYSNIPTIVATKSPYCFDLDRIYSRKETRFSAPEHVHQSVILSDASMRNWPIIRKAVFCDPWAETLYPIGHEDLYNGIKAI